MKERILYISYDSVLEPLGHSQVFRYIESLSKEFEFHLISFEKGATRVASRNSLFSNRLSQLGITWIPLRYHKSPRFLATLYDVIRCVFVASSIIRNNKIRVIHARSFIPVFIAFVLNSFLKLKIIYDTRGFWVDERVAAGFLHRDTISFFLLSKLDQYFMSKSSHVVVLTNAAFDFLSSSSRPDRLQSRYSVIPTCVDLEQFALKKERVSREDSIIIGYVGSASVTNLFEEFVLFLSVFETLQINFRVLVLNKGENTYIENKLLEAGLLACQFEIEEVDHDEVHLSLTRIDFAVFFKKNGLSSTGCSPTRFAELMAAGVPCFFNTGIGDLDYLLRRYRIGASVPCFCPEVLRSSIITMMNLLNDQGLAQRCRRVAEQYFPLSIGAKAYSIIYSNLLSTHE